MPHFFFPFFVILFEVVSAPGKIYKWNERSTDETDKKVKVKDSLIFLHKEGNEEKTRPGQKRFEI